MKLLLTSIFTLLLFYSCEDNFYSIEDIAYLNEENINSEYDLSEYSLIETDSNSDTYYHTNDMDLLIYFTNMLNDEDITTLSLTEDVGYYGVTWGWWPVYNDGGITVFNLTSLYLDGNILDINDDDLLYIASLENLNLEILDLEYTNNITTIPSLINFTSLKHLDLWRLDYLITIEELPSSFEDLRINYSDDLVSIQGIPNTLKSLDINYCGDLQNFSINPFSIESLERLELRDIESNFIIPENINLPQLETLILSGYNFSGTLPNQLYNSNNLKHLEINYTLIEGTISENISMLEDLNFLDLANNLLNGEVPFKNDQNQPIGVLALALDDLNYLNLSNNQFTGQVPSELFSNYNLVTIDLSNNNFSGDISENICTYLYVNNNNSNLSNNNFCGNIPECVPSLIDISGQDCEE